MPLLNIVAPQDATGQVKEVYDMIMEKARVVPKPLFVLKAVKTPEATTAEDVAALRAMGWTDQDILDATCHGTDMVRHGTLFKAFKLDAD